jgi:hypothetical protein
MESFISLLRKNVLDRRSWGHASERRISIVTWIELTTTDDDAAAADKPRSAG